jgi:hypothetical protein
MKFNKVSGWELVCLFTNTLHNPFTQLSEQNIDVLSVNKFSNYRIMCEFSQLSSDRRVILML